MLRGFLKTLVLLELRGGSQAGYSIISNIGKLLGKRLPSAVQWRAAGSADL